MIILKLTDGLGNQMFQYAYARYIQEEYHEKKLYLDITKLGDRHLRRYALCHFLLNENVVVPNILIQYASRLYVKLLLNLYYRVLGISTKTEKGVRLFSKSGLYTNTAYFRFFSFERTCLPVKFVRGFFQNEKYFEKIKEVVHEEFKLKAPLTNKKVNELLKIILEKDSVCVHIRRGDYITNKRFNVCTESYYKQGIDLIKRQYPNVVFFVFSNSSEDVDWIRNNYNFEGDVRFVDEGYSEIEDFYLMSRCRHFVISNSTFSWWAAYLSDYDNKIVIAPKPWINSQEYQEGIYCDGWVALDVK